MNHAVLPLFYFSDRSVAIMKKSNHNQQQQAVTSTGTIQAAAISSAGLATVVAASPITTKHKPETGDSAVAVTVTTYGSGWVLGKTAWEAYAAAVGGKAFNGDPLPTWEAMGLDNKKAHLVSAWIKAAEAVEAYVLSATSEMNRNPNSQVQSWPPALPPLLRTLPQRTRCCGAINLTLNSSQYSCPCGDHVESV